MVLDRSIIESWLAMDPDEETRDELRCLLEAGDEEELSQRFSGRLEFGTAGLRGLLGAGPSRMNRLVVRQTAAGLAQYLLDTVPDAARRGVVVGCDARRLSREMAKDASDVLAACGLAVHLFEELVPTPLVAFGVRHLGAAAGVMVTASHNPPEYNGFKVYWESGAQIVPPHDEGIATAIEVASQQELPFLPHDEALARGAIRLLGPQLEQAYLEGVGRLSLHPKSTKRSRLVLAYTPLHGVGARLASRVLAQAGFTAVHMVESQAEPDGSFPTVRFPNPEEKGAMDAVLELAARVDADLACANDPDADRLCAAVKKPGGGYRVLSGDELGVLLGFDQLVHGPSNAVVGTTLVSSSLLRRVARHLGRECYETLTGFKWLATRAIDEEARGNIAVFAYEEALGYGFMRFVRDKDGLSALCALCELSASLAEGGQTLLTQLEALYRQHGLVLTGQRTIALSPGAPNLGERLRAAPPTHIGGRKVESTADLLRGDSGLPQSDVLVFMLEGGARAIVRPSGTEPKVKCYYEVEDAIAPGETLEQAEPRARAQLATLADTHLAELRASL